MNQDNKFSNIIDDLGGGRLLARSLSSFTNTVLNEKTVRINKILKIIDFYFVLHICMTLQHERKNQSQEGNQSCVVF